ncbi:MAG: LCP family protein [Clostridia bacterium]|nr:LCP family protein [Clostridia bacterium]
MQNSLINANNKKPIPPYIWIILGLVLGVIVVIATLFIVKAVSGDDIETYDHEDEVEEIVIEEVTTELIEEEEVVPEPYNVLVLGTDIEAGLPDVIMLCRIDPAKEKASILSIPRDTKVVSNGTTMKINSTYSQGGLGQVVDSVERLTGLDVDHYFMINLEAFRDIVNAVDGIYYNVPRNMDYEDPLQDLYIHLKSGYQLLDGGEAEELVRFRQYPDGDIGRIRVQQDFVKKLIEQKLNILYVEKIPEVYEIIEYNSNTDMTVTQMLEAGTLLVGMGESNVQSFIVPGDGAYEGDVSYYIHNSRELNELIKDEFK